jgi:hypothetical protein
MKGLYVPGGRSHRTMKDVALTDALEILRDAGRLRKGEHKKLYALLDRADINNPPRGEESNGRAEDHAAYASGPHYSRNAGRCDID